MCNPQTAKVYNFTNATNPALTTPVILEFDYNLYWNCAHSALPPQPGKPWDEHSIAADPLMVGESGPVAVAPWERVAADLALSPLSPAYSLPGFRRISVEDIGLGSDFFFDMASWGRRGPGGVKIQAETYDRQVGLWREGSYAISPGPKNWAFQPGAWALYKRVDVTGATAVVLRVGAAKGSSGGLTMSVALGTPDGVIANLALNATAAPVGVMGTFSIPLQGAPLTLSGANVFLLPQSQCIIDYFLFT